MAKNRYGTRPPRRLRIEPLTAEEILEKARKEARPLSPSERRSLERKGQMTMAEYEAWPRQWAR